MFHVTTEPFESRNTCGFSANFVAPENSNNKKVLGVHTSFIVH
jgi:hypothetical protein